MNMEAIADVTSEEFSEFVKTSLGSREIVDVTEYATDDYFYLVVETGLTIFEFYYKYEGVFEEFGQKYFKSSFGKAGLSLLGYQKVRK